MTTSEPYLFRRVPVPIFCVDMGRPGHSIHPQFEYISLLQRAGNLIDRDLWACAFRGLALQKFPTVISAGIDVIPTNSVIFVDDFEKAWEYGGWPKVLLALDWTQLDHTFRELPIDTPPQEIASISSQFPTSRVSRDGRHIWLSRLADTDPRVTTDYEIAYARWIPGDPFETLWAILVFGVSGQELAATLGES